MATTGFLVVAIGVGASASRQAEGFDDLERPPPATSERLPPADPLGWPSRPEPPAQGAYLTPGRVTRVHEDLALVEMPPGVVPAPGQNVAFGTAEGTASFETTTEGEIVGEVEFLRPDGAVVRIGPGQQVAVGETARLTARGVTSSIVAPAVPDHLLRLELMGGATLRTPGVVGEARLSLHHRAAFVYAEMQPSVYAAARVVGGVRIEPSTGVSGTLGGGFQQRFVAVGVGFGMVQARRGTTSGGITGGAEPTLVTHLRLGALDGLSFVTDLALSVGSRHYDAVYRMNFGLYAPCSSKVLLGLRGGTWLTQQSYSDLHLVMRVRVRGNGGPDSWYVRGALSFYWLRDVVAPTTPTPSYYYANEGALLGVQVGLERRFGLGGS